MTTLDGPNVQTETVTPLSVEWVVLEAEQGEKQLATTVEQISPVVDAIIADINTHQDEKSLDLMQIISTGIEKLTTAIKGKNRSEAITGFTDIIKTIFSSGPKKPSYRKSERNDWSLRMDQFTDHDIDVLFSKMRLSSLSPEKKMSYARLISRRWDAEHALQATDEPKQTQEMLEFQVSKWRIAVGDMMIFWWPEQWWDLKEFFLRAHLKAEHTHAAVITSVEPLEITHATKDGVHTTPLMSYIAKHKLLSYAVIAGGGAVARSYAKQQEWKKYDLTNAMVNKFGDDESQFCSELALRAFAQANGLDIAQLEQEGKVFPAHLLSLSYPKYVGDYPREVVQTEYKQQILT